MINWDFWKKKKRRNDYETMPWSQGYDQYGDGTRSSMFASGDDDWDVTTARPVFSSRPEAARGGRSYEDFLRARGQSRWDGPYGGGPRRFYDEEEEYVEGNPLRRGMQILGAIALVGLLYITFQSEQPFAQKVQGFVAQSMTEDSNFEALPTWWRENVSGKVDVPVMSTPNPATPAPNKITFAQPVEGIVKTPFDGKEQQGITYTAAKGAEVRASSAGVVEKVEQAGPEDFTVTINHGTTGKTIYRHLAAAAVNNEAWVQGDQAIGTLSKKSEKAELFFAFQKDGQFVDPASMITQP